ncbi:MAG: hypothetical protein AB1468_04060 [Candidatus Micrarchaeota archaeon]
MIEMLVMLQTLQPPPSAWSGPSNATTILENFVWGPGGWEPVALTAVLIGFFIVAIAYMIGRAFDVRELKQWAKSEFYQAAASAILVVGLIALVDLLMGQAASIVAGVANQQGWAVGRTGNPFEVAHDILDHTINCAKMLYRWIFALNMLIEPVEKTAFEVGGIDTQTFWALTPLVQAAHYFCSRLSFILIAAYAQRHFLYFIEQTMFTVFLPLGVILRAIPYSRGAGAFLVALSIGLYIVYPVTMTILIGTWGPTLSTCALQPAGTVEIDDNCAVDIASIGRTTYEAQRSIPWYLKWLEYTKANFAIMFWLMWVPIVSAILVFTFIRTMSSYLGADIGEIGQGLIKLI